MATRDQIGKKLFRGLTRQNVERRLKKLLIERYIVKKDVGQINRTVAAFGLEDKGFEIFRNKYEYPITEESFKSDSVAHDICLVDLRSRLEQTKMLVKYLPENVLQACEYFQSSEEFQAFSRLNSDAALVLDTKVGRLNVAFEFECSAKSVSRYVRKMRDYYLSSNIEAVLYVCENVGIERTLRQAELEAAATFDPKIFFCQIEKFQNQNSDLVFCNRNNGRFILS